MWSRGREGVGEESRGKQDKEEGSEEDWEESGVKELLGESETGLEGREGEDI